MRLKQVILFIMIMTAWTNIHSQGPMPTDSLIRELQEVVVKAKQPATKLVGSSLVSTIAGSSL